MKSFGTLEYEINEDGHGKWKITGPQPALMISRIVPNSWGHVSGQVVIDDNYANVEHIEWLTWRYPLEIKCNGIWDKKLAEIHRLQSLRNELETLHKVSPAAAFQGKLYGFQEEGLDFMLKTGGNCLIADDMGLGKTVEALAYITTDKETLPALIIAPLITLVDVWKRQIEKFLKVERQNNPLVPKDTLDKPICSIIRSGKSSKLPAADFYIINYELVYKRVDDLRKLGIKTIVADEAQHLRNRSTNKYQGVKQLASVETVKHKIGLSGTPIYNHGSEIWSIVDVINPGILGTFSEFFDMYCYNDFRGRAIIHEDKRRALRDRLRESIMLRRRKIDVLTELPDKVRYKQIVDADIEYYYRELQKAVEQADKESIEAKTAFEKIAIAERVMQHERQIAGVAKAPYVVKFVKDLMEIDESIVVYCHHHLVHALLKTELREFYPATIIGGQTDNDRQYNIDEFQRGETKLMIAGIRAGNLGISLTQASYVIFAELDWSPAIHRQAEDRLHRIGQKNNVFAYYLIGKDTLDVEVARVLVDKTLEIDSIMGDTKEREDPKRAKEVLNDIRQRLALARAAL